jgi:hypothetical protein
MPVLRIFGQIDPKADEARTFFDTAVRDLIKSLQNNPHYATTEMKAIEKELDIGPAFFDNPASLGSRMVGIDDFLMQKLRAAQTDATNESYTLDARKNLRKLCQIRKREGLFNLHSEPLYQEFGERVNRKWLEMCQIIEENGFESVNHLLFASLNKTQLYVLLNFIYIDLIEFASEHKTPGSTRKKYCTWMKSLLSKFVKFKYGSLQASFNVVRTLLSILNDCPQPYTVCFIIISAVVRL